MAARTARPVAATSGRTGRCFIGSSLCGLCASRAPTYAHSQVPSGTLSCRTCRRADRTCPRRKEPHARRQLHCAPNSRGGRRAAAVAATRAGPGQNDHFRHLGRHELTAYRGTNPYLTSTWDPESRLFTDVPPGDPAYPLAGWGYSEVGEVVEVADPGDTRRTRRTSGSVTWSGASGATAAEGRPGRRAPARSPAARRARPARRSLRPRRGHRPQRRAGRRHRPRRHRRRLRPGRHRPARHRLAVAERGPVIAVDGIAGRRELARAWGAAEVFAPVRRRGLDVRELTGGRGRRRRPSSSAASTRPCTRPSGSVGADGRVVAAGFYQGAASALRLGEEFHHNRVEVIASQIGAVPLRTRARWDVAAPAATPSSTCCPRAVSTSPRWSATLRRP